MMNNDRFPEQRQERATLRLAFFLLALFPLYMIPAISLSANDDKYIITDPPVLQGACEKESILRIGYSWIWQQAPDLLEETTLQKNNDAPLVKIRPKKSSQLSDNYFGTNTSGMPRSRLTDYQPLEAVHLIDGDDQTCWLSRGTRRPDQNSPWIRLDFPVEQTLNKFVLKKRINQYERPDHTKLPVATAVEVGRALPLRMIVQGSRDGYNWIKIFDGETKDTPEKNEFSFTIQPPQTFKSVRIIASETVNTENFGYSFSISELELYDLRGKNVALISSGTGIVGSSTERGRNEIDALRSLWALYHELGFKWVRIGYHDDPINWHEVEKVKGKLEVDPVTDHAITELSRQGLNLIMCLDFGNRLYTMPELELSQEINRNEERPFPQLWEWYYDSPRPPVDEEALKAWDRYVVFMVEKYKDRVKYFEIWNEWNIPLYWGDVVNIDHYLALARRTVPLIRKHAPNVPILAGSTSGFPMGCSSWTSEQWKNMEKNDLCIRMYKELFPLVDAIGWHPYYQPDPNQLLGYPDDVKALKQWAKSLGFKGKFMSTEWNMSYNYPDFKEKDVEATWRASVRSTEMQKAKYVLQCFAQDAGLDLISCFCEMHQPFYGALDLSLMRRSADSEPTSLLQPEAAFYASRNLATMMDGFKPSDIPWEISSEPQIKNLRGYSFTTPNGSALVLWIGGTANDRTERIEADLKIQTSAISAVAMDPINGVSQPLHFQAKENQIIVPKIMINDIPLIIRFDQKP